MSRRAGPDEPAQFLSLSEAASMIGVSRTTIVKNVANGTLPTLRLGATVRIPLQAILSLVSVAR